MIEKLGRYCAVVHGCNDSHQLGELVYVVGSAPHRKHVVGQVTCSHTSGCRNGGMPSHATSCSRSSSYERTTSHLKNKIFMKFSTETMNRVYLHGSRACRSSCDTPTSSSVTALRLVLTHQDIWNPHLQHTVMPWISSRSFKNWTPMLWVAEQECINLLGRPLAPSVARPNVVEQMYGFELRCGSYVWITEVTRLSSIEVINLFSCKNAKKNLNHKTVSTPNKNQSDIGVRRKDYEMCEARRRTRRRYEYFQWPAIVRPVRGISGNKGRVKRKGNETPHTLEGNEIERHCMNCYE